MTACFADSFYYFALLNPRDHAHAAAVELTRRLRRPVVTTTMVLTEVADGLASTSARRLFLPFLDRLRATPQMTIVPPSDALFQNAVDLYAARPDKQWSLTDCASMAVMRQLGLTDVLTGDHHFEQAGFNILFKP